MRSVFCRGIVACAVVIVMALSVESVFAAPSGTIRGRISDKDTHDPLPGAAVQVKNTGIGMATDLDGKYLLRNVPVGRQTLTVSYLGYVPVTMDVTITEDATLDQDAALTAQALEGETVVVTAQAQGQVAAINQQLSSNTIKNVVSEKRIQELPDFNAAEAMGRLPGVTTLRSSGEGNRIVVRGISPENNVVAINGVEVGATNNTDRSVDLSMITPNMLRTIEVIKALTPDLDGDAIGGYVNMQLREAPDGFHSDLLWQSGYAKYTGGYTNYKAVGQVSDRFFDNDLGVFLLGNVEQVDRSADNYNANYITHAQTAGVVNDLFISQLTLNRHFETRQRFGANAILDYRLPNNGKLELINFYSRLTADTRDYSTQFNTEPNTNTLVWTFTKGKTYTDIVSNALQGQHDLGLFTVDYSISNSYTRNNTPKVYNSTVWEQGAFNTALFNTKNPDPTLVSSSLSPLRWAEIDMQTLGVGTRDYQERGQAYMTNFTFPFALGDLNTSGFFKFGGKFKYMYRVNDENNLNAGVVYGADVGFNSDWLALVPEYRLAQDANARVYGIQLATDPAITSNFLGNTYGDLIYGVRQDMIQTIIDRLDAQTNPSKPIDYSTHWASGPVESFLGGGGATLIPGFHQDFTYLEKRGAAYAMSQFNVGRDIMLMGGVRYENEDRFFTGYQVKDISNVVRATVPYKAVGVPGNNHFLLPMIHAQYKVTDWADIRYAYTQTIARPSFNALTPSWYINIEGATIIAGNQDLTPAKSVNHDLIVSIYNNEVGLFTVGGFYKEIENNVFAEQYNIVNAPALAAQFLNGQWVTSPLTGGWKSTADYPLARSGAQINTFVNSQYKAYLSGLEVDLQTRFWYLPSPLNGLVLNVNYTHTFSTTRYPWLTLGPALALDPTKPRTKVQTYVDSSRNDSRLINQPENLVNVALGYDYEGFSGRISLSYIGNMIRTIAPVPENDSQTAQFLRLDVTLKQTLPWYDLQVYLNLNNINNRKDEATNVAIGVPVLEQFYGFTADLGLRWTL